MLRTSVPVIGALGIIDMRRRTLLLFPLLARAACVRAESEPRSANIVSRNACPLECCPYDQELPAACAKATYRNPSSEEIAFSIQRGDKITLKSSFVFTRRAGVANVMATAHIAKLNSESNPTKAIATLVPGSTLLVLYPQGRNCHRVVYNGITYSADLTRALATEKIKLVSEPQYTWWARIQNEADQSGWAKNPDDLFAEMACGKNA